MGRFSLRRGGGNGDEGGDANKDGEKPEEKAAKKPKKKAEKKPAEKKPEKKLTKAERAEKEAKEAFVAGSKARKAGQYRQAINHLTPLSQDDKYKKVLQFKIEWLICHALTPDFEDKAISAKSARANLQALANHDSVKPDMKVLAWHVLSYAYEKMSHEEGQKKANRVKQARTCADAALAIDPEHGLGLLALANTYLRQKRMDKAEAAFKKAPDKDFEGIQTAIDIVKAINLVLMRAEVEGWKLDDDDDDFDPSAESSLAGEPVNADQTATPTAVFETAAADTTVTPGSETPDPVAADEGHIDVDDGLGSDGGLMDGIDWKPGDDEDEPEGGSPIPIDQGPDKPAPGGAGADPSESVNDGSDDGPIELAPSA